MTQAKAGSDEGANDAELPRRDWLLLPALSLLTIFLLAGAMELVARSIFYRLPTSGENCLMMPDPSRGAQGIPNCVVWEKIPEGKATEYRFNTSGYRDNADFGPKASGTFRIVVVGTSVAAGFRVAQEQTMSALLPAELSQRLGRKVEVYNEGLPSRTTDAIARDLDQAIAVDPNMILWIVSPLDVAYPAMMEHPEAAGALGMAPGLDRSWSLIKDVFAKQSFLVSIATLFSHTASATMLRDWLYRSPSQYVQSSLAGADYKKDFLLSEPGAEFREELSEFDRGAASIAEQASKAGIPLVVVFVPDRTQAAMIAMMSGRPAGFNPYQLSETLRAIVQSHGGTYVDILPDFRTVPNPQLGYFALDGHPNALGHAMLAHFVTDKLVKLASAAQTPPPAGPQTRP